PAPVRPSLSMTAGSSSPRIATSRLTAVPTAITARSAWPICDVFGFAAATWIPLKVASLRAWNHPVLIIQPSAAGPHLRDQVPELGQFGPQLPDRAGSLLLQQ